MAAQKGADLLMKIGDGGSPESFTTIGGMRSTSLSMNDEMVDITNKDTGRARTILAQGGTTSMTVTGSGVFTDTASEATLRSKFDESGLTNFQFLVPNFGTFTGNFPLDHIGIWWRVQRRSDLQFYVRKLWHNHICDGVM